MLIIYTNLILFSKIILNIDYFIAKKSFKENNNNRLMRRRRMKKKIITIAFSMTLLLLLLASIASASTVQACNSFYNKDNLPIQLMSSEIIAAAHWIENTPAPGGWIFAALAREPGLE